MYRHAAVLVAGGQIVEGRGHEPELAFEVRVFRLEGWRVGGLGLGVVVVSVDGLGGMVFVGFEVGGEGDHLFWGGGL